MFGGKLNAADSICGHKPKIKDTDVCGGVVVVVWWWWCGGVVVVVWWYKSALTYTILNSCL